MSCDVYKQIKSLCVSALQNLKCLLKIGRTNMNPRVIQAMITLKKDILVELGSCSSSPSYHV